MIRLEAIGIPAAKGSARAMLVGGKPRVIASGSTANQKRQAGWGEAIANAIERLRSPAGIYQVGGAIQTAALDCAVVTATIYRLAPLRAHFDEQGPKADAPLVARTGHDLEKLQRSTHDHITAAGGIWTDDARVAASYAARLYAPPGGWLGAIVYVAAFEERSVAAEAWEAVIAGMARELAHAIGEASSARTLARQAKRRSPKQQSRAQAASTGAIAGALEPPPKKPRRGKGRGVDAVLEPAGGTQDLFPLDGAYTPPPFCGVCGSAVCGGLHDGGGLPVYPAIPGTLTPKHTEDFG